ncbi:MAG: hypothetical protein FWG40_00510 [Peptococcaceae bacterium]|nr:hypothetical protein [Peptococcaceae bacterium]
MTNITRMLGVTSILACPTTKPAGGSKKGPFRGLLHSSIIPYGYDIINL